MKFHQLEEASRAVLDNCAKTLDRQLDTKESVVQFCALYSGTEDEVIGMKLIALMNNLPPLTPPPCSNCQETPCKSGTAITSVKQVRTGTVMMPNSDCVQLWKWNIEHRGDAVVKSISEHNKTVMVEEGNGAYKFALVGGYDVINSYSGIQDDIPSFRFNCRK